MPSAEIRFFEELNDFLPVERKKKWFTSHFNSRVSVKDLIESTGVPHPEVALIQVNSQSEGWDYIVRDRDKITVYPAFETFDISKLTQLQRIPLLSTRFVLDVHLGRLASLLRIAGFDCLYRNDYQDSEIARISADENRILLTRDRGVLKRSIVTYAYYIRETNPRRQLEEVLKRFDLLDRLNPFSRCPICNDVPVPVEKRLLGCRIPEKTRAYHQEFRECHRCHKVFWKGSHYDRMQEYFSQIIREGMIRRARKI